MSSTPLESTWLYHEIGRCYLEIDKFEEAKDFGERSKKSAMEAEDEVWQLNASVLIAQAHGRRALKHSVWSTRYSAYY